MFNMSMKSYFGTTTRVIYQYHIRKVDRSKRKDVQEGNFLPQRTRQDEAIYINQVSRDGRNLRTENIDDIHQ